MRRAFFTALAELADRDDRVVLLTGDLGFMFIEEFADRHPRRFFNAGVAEQNMVGMATGLARSGLHPFTYSIATFATLRPFEFIRNGPVLHDLPVRIVGVGGGFEYGTAGITHHALEDVAVMRTQPGLTVLAPVDHRQAFAAVHATSEWRGPIYFRLGKDERAVLDEIEPGFVVGRVDRIGRGLDVCLVSTGAIAREAVAAGAALGVHGIAATVLLVPTVSPAPMSELADLLRPFTLVLSIEAHYTVGGLGSLIAEVMAESASPGRLVRVGVERRVDGVVGSEAFLNERHGLTSAGVVARVTSELGHAGARR